MVKAGGQVQPTTSRRHEQQLTQDLQEKTEPRNSKRTRALFWTFHQTEWHLSTMWREVWMVAPGKGRREGGFRTSPTRPRRFRATLIRRSMDQSDQEFPPKNYRQRYEVRNCWSLRDKMEERSTGSTWGNEQRTRIPTQERNHKMKQNKDGQESPLLYQPKRKITKKKAKKKRSTVKRREQLKWSRKKKEVKIKNDRMQHLSWRGW